MDENGQIPPNLRTLRILEVLGQSDKSMSPTEINQHLGLPKQTVHRLCKTLIKEGYLFRDTTAKGLRPSRRVREMASGILFASRFHIARHQVLLDVAEQVSETVNFVIPENEGMTYLDRVETDWPFRIQLPVGTHVPFHCTASGKTFLASLSPSFRKSMVESIDLKKQTVKTLTNKTKLMHELDKISKQGYALDDEEFMDGMVAIAVPVCDPSGKFLAALAFHGPIQRLSTATALKNRDILLEGANRLTKAIFS